MYLFILDHCLHIITDVLQAPLLLASQCWCSSVEKNITIEYRPFTVTVLDILIIGKSSECIIKVDTPDLELVKTYAVHYPKWPKQILNFQFQDSTLSAFSLPKIVWACRFSMKMVNTLLSSFNYLPNLFWVLLLLFLLITALFHHVNGLETRKQMFCSCHSTVSCMQSIQDKRKLYGAYWADTSH